MKNNISIVYFGDLYDVNGINFVTNLFVSGKINFKNNNLNLNKIFSQSGVVNISAIETINIGKDVNTKEYYLKRILRSNLSKLLTSKNVSNAWFKICSSIINPAKAVIEKNIVDLLKEEVLIFQDIFTAYYFLKKENKNSTSKTVLILHCERDPFEQLLGNYPSLRDTKYHTLLLEMKNCVYNKISKVVFLSKKAYYRNSELYAKSIYIYNGIDELDSISECDAFFNIVCVGSMTGHKGQEYIIEALSLLNKKKLPNIRLHLIGAGNQEKELKRLTIQRKLTENVTFYGIRNDVKDLLKKMNLMILPSKSEGMPLAILEGMRQGMYILATDVGGISEMIGNDFGDLISRDPVLIKEKIEEVIDLEEDYYKKKAREAFARKFTKEQMINRYSKMIQEL